MNPEKITLSVEEEYEDVIQLEKLELKQIVICLKSIQSSIKLWTQKAETQGYLNEIAQFMGIYVNPIKYGRNRSPKNSKTSRFL